MKHNIKRVYKNVLEMIGSTPLLKLNNYPKSKGIHCQLYTKLESYNPGGSIKDRIGLKMIESAEAEKKLKKTDIVVEATSGNTGMGVLLSSIIKKYKTIITISDRNSNEKISKLKAFGADVKITPYEKGHDDPENNFYIANELNKQEGYFHTDQFNNKNNPGAHYENTAEEILDQMEGEIDYIFACVGTGGTISGIGKKLKEKLKNCKIIGIDPYGSILARPDWKNIEGPHNYNLEGIGNKFIYDVLNYDYVDDFVKIGDKNSFIACREIMIQDGIFPGGSSGACLAGAVKYLKRHGLDKDKDLKCVLVFADGLCNYMSKFVSDSWMVGQGYMNPEILYEDHHPLKNYFLKDFDFIKKIPFFKENE